MTKKRSKAAQLQALYAQLPTINCALKCQLACGPIAMSREERRLLVKATGRAPAVDASLTCIFLTNGLCRAYELRPLICRLWGVTANMPCPHGCVPERVLTREEGFAFLRRARAIGGEDRHGENQMLDATLRTLRTPSAIDTPIPQLPDTPDTGAQAP